MPLLSLGLPVYNGGDYLEQAIDSMLNQTFSDFELIISDNASVDRTEEICRRYESRDDRIQYYRHDKNLGASFNYNYTFERSSGKYFKWVAHDDMCEKEFLSTCITALEQNPEAVLAFSHAKVIDSKGRLLKELDYNRRVDSPEPYIRFHDIILSMHVITEIFGVIRTDVLKKTELIGRFTSSDRLLLAQLVLYGPFAIVKQPLFLHRDHENRSHKKLKTPNARIGWFDPSKAGQKTFPSWRILRQCLKGIWNSPLGPRPKASCYIELLRWAKRNSSFLINELFTAMGRSTAAPESETTA